MTNIKLSCWVSGWMPVAIDTNFGYATDRVEIPSGAKRYVWVKVGPLFFELFWFSPSKGNKKDERNQQPEHQT